MKLYNLNYYYVLTDIKEHQKNKLNLLGLINQLEISKISNKSDSISKTDWNLPKEVKRNYLTLFYDMIRPYMNDMATKMKFNKWNIFNPKKPRRMELDVNGLKYPGSYTFTYENHSLYEKAMNLTYGNKLPPFKYYLTVLATFKNEGKILEEWLEHHITHGIEHFYLVNDHSTDNCMSLLAPYLENGIVTMFNAPSVASQFRQVALYRNSIVRIMATNE